MGVVEVPPPGAGSAKPTRPTGIGWWAPTVAGAAAFWSANFVISLTPVAGAYRSAMSIHYLPMLVEAAAGGLVVASAVALVLVRYPERVPGAGPLRKALLLSAGSLVLLTLFVEVPSKLGSGVADPGHWLIVATVFNAIRVLALGLASGLVTRAGETRRGAHRPATRREARS